MTAETAHTIAAFTARHGLSPAGVWSAPGRVNLIGEHTDYNLGFSLPFAIDRRTTVAAAPLADPVVRVSSDFSDDLVEAPLDGLTPETVQGWSAYPLGVLWSFGDQGVPVGQSSGVALHFTSTVPVGAGLSSSAALECATAVAIQDLWGTPFDRAELARICQRAENIAVGAPTGILDQSASMLGRQDAAVFLDFLAGTGTVVPLGLDEAGLVVLVVDSKVSHAHSTGGYAAVRAACERGAALLEVESLRELRIGDLDRAARILDVATFSRVRHVVTENERTLRTVELLRAGKVTQIGPELDASHASLRDDFGVSTPELDVIVETACAHGALGARMTGGGFGGSAIALAPVDAVEGITGALRRRFADQNWTEPDAFVVRATEGARRDLWCNG